MPDVLYPDSQFRGSIRSRASSVLASPSGRATVGDKPDTGLAAVGHGPIIGTRIGSPHPWGPPRGSGPLLR
jgi:hypothetical protein